jgi:hypothetical protein
MPYVDLDPDYVPEVEKAYGSYELELVGADADGRDTTVYVSIPKTAWEEFKANVIAA